MYGYIYIVTNKINNKVYIGQHKYDKPELDPNYTGSGVILVEAYKKYGMSNFETALICTAESKSELNNLEITYIRYYRETQGDDNVYNIADGGQGGDFYPMTKERRRKIGDALRGRKRDPEVVKRCAAAKIGHTVSEESRLKSRLSNIGQKRSEEARRNMSLHHANVTGNNNPFFGKHHSAEALQKIGNAAKGRNSNKRWITNGIDSLLIDISKIDSYLDNGYKYGRAKVK